VPQATVKTYDSITRTGVLVSDDGSTEYPIDPAAMDSGMFRFLRPGQRVTFDMVKEGDREVVRNLRIGVAQLR
jgi:cold shock CspA family protein